MTKPDALTALEGKWIREELCKCRVAGINPEAVQDLVAALKMVEPKLPPAPISATLSTVGTDTPVTLGPAEAAMLRAAIAKAKEIEP